MTDANEAPTITSNGAGSTANVNVTENATAVTTVAATDPDADTNVTYSIVGGGDASRFTIDATTGALSFVSAPNYESPTDVGANNTYEVTVQASDGSLTDTQTIIVSVTNANEAPTDISHTGGTANEDSVAGTVVATLSATDPDAGETFTYTITSDPSGALQVVGNEIRIKAGSQLDYEGGDTQNPVQFTLSQPIIDAAAGGANVTISGVPAGATLSVGTNNGDGSWTVPSAEVTGTLTITPPANYYQSIELTATAGTTQTALSTNFNSGASGFTFNDTGGAYSSGSSGTDLGITMGSVDNNTVNNLTASWSKSFTVTGAGTGTLNFDYRMIMADEYDAGEYGEVRVKIDGQLVTLNGNQYVAHADAAEGTTGVDYDSGWQSVSLDLGSLSAGLHTIELVAFNNKKTATDEDMTVRFDNLTLEIDSSVSSTMTVEPVSTYDVSVQVTDSGGNTRTEVIEVTANNVNEAPTDLEFGGNSAITINANPLLDVNSTSDALTAPSGLQVDNQTTFTIEMKVNFDSIATTGWECDLIAQNNGYSQNGFYLAVQDRKLTYAQWSGGSYQGGATQSSTLTAGTDYTISLVVNNGTATIYLNGVSVGSGAVPSPMANSSALLSFLESFNGKISEIRVWDPALTQAQIQANLNADLAGSESGLMALYEFDEGSGSTVVDVTGHGYNLTIANGSSTWIDSGSGVLAAGTVVGEVTSVADDDVGDTASYSLTSDAGGKYAIDAETGEISLVSSHTASSVNSNTVTVRVTDSDGNVHDETIGIRLGTTGDNTLTGGTMSDIVYGGGGNDTITGDDAGDALYGGDGDDTFIYGTGDGSDAVQGGVGWTDVIQLQGMDGAITTNGQTVTGQGWTMVLDEGSSVQSQVGESLVLSNDASGTIVFSDGSTMTFDEIEKIVW